jgi:hypothetical protein
MQGMPEQLRRIEAEASEQAAYSGDCYNPASREGRGRRKLRISENK